MEGLNEAQLVGILPMSVPSHCSSFSTLLFPHVFLLTQFGSSRFSVQSGLQRMVPLRYAVLSLVLQLVGALNAEPSHSSLSSSKIPFPQKGFVEIVGMKGWQADVSSLQVFWSHPKFPLEK